MWKQIKAPGWAVVGVVISTALMGCAPEKPSDARAADLEVAMDSFENLEDQEAVVARVGGEEITREEFDRRVEGLVDFARLRLQSAEQREDFLARIVEFEIMADEAELRGYGEHARTRHAMKEAMVDIMVEEWLRNEVSIAEIDEVDRAQYFEEHEGDFLEPERRRVAQIVVDTRDDAEELRQRWEDGQLNGDDDDKTRFQRFAFYYSLERQSGDRGGDLGWRESGEESRFGEDVFDWEPERVYGPFDDDGEWVLKMVIEMEDEVSPVAEELEQQIVHRIYEERRQRARDQWVEGLTASADVELWPERLDAIEPPTDEVPPRLEDLPRTSLDEAMVADEKRNDDERAVQGSTQ